MLLRAFALGMAFINCQLPAVMAAETPLSGAEIASLLAERSLYADGAEQIFRRSGQTFYLQNGASSAGGWKVEGDSYCSVWPPNPAWSCYEVLRDGDQVIFLNRDGKRFPMRLSR